ncbi:MAG: chorismate synthase [Faecalimonas sp.]|nr:chorismate synthase [Faecalimonas sp.]
MKNTFGNSISISLFGESHGEQIGVVIDGLAPGLSVDMEFMKKQLELRKPHGRISTQRVETDEPHIVSGVFEGKTTGTPVCILFENRNTHSKDYAKTKDLMRPGHADYTAIQKYHGFADYRGGGHFSGRLTTPIVAAGAIALDALKKKGIHIGTHIRECGNISDGLFADCDALELEKCIAEVNEKQFPVLEEEAAKAIYAYMEAAALEGDSVGGILETAVTGLPAGLGEPWFDSMESILAHGMFSIPAVKGVEFGKGFAFAQMKGSEANDAFTVADGCVRTKTNHNGGINGGISNGMPVLFQTVVKPTPSIYKEQDTINVETQEKVKMQIQGRHDPAIIHRARVVVDSMTALVIVDLLALRYGTDWLKGNE